MYSQFGEDDILLAMFSGRIGCAVDVGAGDGISGNNTIALENVGWKVLCIEPNPLYAESLRKHRKLSMNVACGSKDAENVDFHVYEVPWTENGKYQSVSALVPSGRLIREHATCAKHHSTHKVSVRTLDRCLDEFGFTGLDVLCIDVEEAEADVLKGFSLRRWNPRIAIVENCFDKPFIKQYFMDAGYVISDKLGVNDVYELPRSLGRIESNKYGFISRSTSVALS